MFQPAKIPFTILVDDKIRFEPETEKIGILSVLCLILCLFANQSGADFLQIQGLHTFCLFRKSRRWSVVLYLSLSALFKSTKLF